MSSITDTARYLTETGAQSKQSHPMDTISPRADDYRREVIELTRNVRTLCLLFNTLFCYVVDIYTVVLIWRINP